VVALKNGTMGWHLAGFALEHGNERHAPAPGAEALAKARDAAARVAARFGVKPISPAELDEMRRDAKRTLYCFDVRSPKEYREGHLASFSSAPGGQLVQATDTYAVVRNARIVLADSDGVRATMTASWLLQMGWPEVRVLEMAAGMPLVAGHEPRRVLGLDGAKPDEVAAAELQRLLEAGATAVIDFASSLAYRDGHIPGAWFAIRARLANAFGRIGPARRYVFTSPDGVLAQLAALDAATLTTAEVQVLQGGTAAWTSADLPLERGSTHLAAATDDVYYRPYDRQGQIEQAMQDYLDWEVALVEQLKREPYLTFRTG
jgi:rhodanese-related sulfurtransferase